MTSPSALVACENYKINFVYLQSSSNHFAQALDEALYDITENLKENSYRLEN